MQKLFVIVLIFILPLRSSADEGMWIPVLLEKLNIADMQQKGLKLTAEDIYSINQACLKDAIVLFGMGCTGEIISREGLLLTNHHCGYSSIQKHSTVEKDYLSQGFWAMSRDEELPNPGLTASILVKMEDVTNRILASIPDDLPEIIREEFIQYNIALLIDSATYNTHYEATIHSFYYGNEYYMFIYEEFKDVRLVGAPPSSIGKFGGDTDNWVWPRHTGDFSLFRIYADKENKPAEYSPDNVPYTPKKHLPVSLKGVTEGDFTMVYGYPYKTYEYLTSHAVRLLLQLQLPKKINLREGKLNILEKVMKSDPRLQLKYAYEQAHIANAYKKWIGVEKGLKERKAVERKQQFEEQFEMWTKQNTKRNVIYGTLLDEFEILYEEMGKYTLAYEYGYEVVLASGLLQFVSSFSSLIYNDNSNGDSVDVVDELKSTAESYFNNYDASVDKVTFTFLMEQYYKDINSAYHPSAFFTIPHKFKNNFTGYVDDIYNKSLFTDQERMMDFLSNYSLDELEKDPVYKLYNDFVDVYGAEIYPGYEGINTKLDSLYRIYMRGIMEMNQNTNIYPDANGSLRITYGKVEGYEPADGIKYEYVTTLKGVFEKEDQKVYDYQVPDGLQSLYEEKDYGNYGVNGTMPVCFIASNHTSGGNSGSPVLNANGELIGINFDRNWEGTMSDIMYNPEICRNISVDIRYVLFIIDKYAKAGYLIDEMTLVE